MKKAFLKSLRVKVIVPVLLMTFIVGGTSVRIFSNAMKKSILAEFTSKGVALAKSLATSSQDTLLNRDASTVQSFIDDYRKISGIGFVYVMGTKGNVIAHTFSPAFPKDLEVGTIDSSSAASAIESKEMQWHGRTFLDIAAPILGGSLGVAHIGMDITGIESDISAVSQEAALVIIALIAAGGFVIFILLNQHVKSIIALSDYANNVSTAKDKSKAIQAVKLESFAQDEVGELAASFSEMMKQIQFNTENLEKIVEERTTGLDQARSVLAQSAKMSSLGEMAGGVAHEINNPLGIIKLVTAQIQDLHEEVPFDRELAREMTTKVIKTTDRIAKIVQGLRSFSRDGGGDPYQEINIKAFLEDTLSLCTERMKNHNVEFTLEPVDEKLYLQGRATEISQIIVNLLNNASDAIEKLPNKWIKLSVQGQENWVEFRIMDCGSGIPLEVQKKLFQPFFTTKDIGKGTGLGLSISHGIVKNHGGQLKLDNQCPNTCFMVRLPKTQQFRDSGETAA